MSQQGRFGKYGEIKRFERLRKAGVKAAFDIIQGKQPPQKFHNEQVFEKSGLQNTALKIRPAKTGEIDFIADLSDQVFAVYGPYREIIMSWFACATTTTLIAKAGKRPIAFGMLGFLSDELYQKGWAELLAIAVISEFQKQGVACKLLEAIEQKAAELHIKQLSLHTAKENFIAQRLFTKSGFVMTLIKERYYPAGQTGLMMIKECG
ncbi:MAG: GNAT family N-acetyltransferase [Desulfobacteraceae bacterium]|nr:MAG: GNAT family N-acetyltransferase [Desulfobacteraceae bacterium]